MELVVVHDIIGRMLAKATVQPNIRRIYDDLLGFDGIASIGFFLVHMVLFLHRTYDDLLGFNDHSQSAFSHLMLATRQV